jgi:ribosomal protein S18 acetylase RimI-like enzyme
MMTERVIREANVGDIEVLADLIGEVQDPHIASRPDTFKKVDADEVAVWVRALFENAAVKIWIAETEVTAQGYLVSVLRHQVEGPFAFSRRWIEVDQIGVRGAFRRSGIARALVDAALAHAAASGIVDVELTSWSFNRDAHEAFRRLGFEPKVIRFEMKRATGLPRY